MLNHITAKPDGVILVLDDYHVLDSKPIDRALGFLIEHMPPQMHMVIASRKDPDLPLARLRARNQLTEVRTPDLRFTSMETSEFMCHVMGLDLSGEDAALIASRTEGWIAGLQLAALSLQGHPDAAGFIRTFSGSHRHVLDYLIEEVLQRQPKSVQDFCCALPFSTGCAVPCANTFCRGKTVISRWQPFPDKKPWSTWSAPICSLFR